MAEDQICTSVMRLGVNRFQAAPGERLYGMGFRGHGVWGMGFRGLCVA